MDGDARGEQRESRALGSREIGILCQTETREMQKLVDSVIPYRNTRVSTVDVFTEMVDEDT